MVTVSCFLWPRPELWTGPSSPLSGPGSCCPFPAGDPLLLGFVTTTRLSCSQSNKKQQVLGWKRKVVFQHRELSGPSHLWTCWSWWWDHQLCLFGSVVPFPPPLPSSCPLPPPECNRSIISGKPIRAAQLSTSTCASPCTSSSAPHSSCAEPQSSYPAPDLSRDPS